MINFNTVAFVVSCITFSAVNTTPCLFQKFPQLQTYISHITLCDLPTPIFKLQNFGDHIGCNSIFIKRDDLTGTDKGNGLRLFGGNKPRKLEFLLADAVNNEAETIITYGCAGSNHALATAVYAHELGFKSIVMLKDQPSSYTVRHNLLLDLYYDAQVQFFFNNEVRDAASNALLKTDNRAYLIPTGGSNTIGTLGFVNAAFELADQVKAQIIDEPDFIYVATGSCATAAGLLLGLQVAQMKSKVVAVTVSDGDFLSKIKELFTETVERLHALDGTFPLVTFPEESLIINKKFCGTQYGLFISEGVEAALIFKNTENINLEGTYTARPIAAIIDDVAQGFMNDKTILFWNTYCGIDYSYLTDGIDYKNLPQEFHCYFEHDVQPLARQ